MNLENSANPFPEIPGFKILEAIGDGESGTVYRARQTSLDRPVAIKILRPDLATNPQGVERFQEEWKCSAALKHTGIVAVFEAGEHRGLHYFVMEFVEGMSLSEFISAGSTMDDETALGVISAVGSALNHALQRAGVTHGNLKPSNIILEADGTAKVTTFFGAGKSVNPYLSHTGNATSRVGNDIHALGSIIMHSITGVGPGQELPVRTSSVADLAYAMLAPRDGRSLRTWNEVVQEVTELLSGRASQELRRPNPARAKPATDAKKEKQTERAPHKAAIRSPVQRGPAVRRNQKRRSADRIGVAVVLLSVGTAGAYLWTHWSGPAHPKSTGSSLQENFPASPGKAAGTLAHEKPLPTNPSSPENIESPEAGNTPRGEILLEPRGYHHRPAATERQLEAYSEYLRTMSSVFRMISHRKYADADETARNWLRMNPSCEFSDAMRECRTRIDRIHTLPTLFFEKRQDLVGMSIRKGVIKSAGSDEIMVFEDRGAGSSSTRIGTDSLSDREYMMLLKRADPDRFFQHGLIYRLSRGQFEEGRQLLQKIPPLGKDAASLRAWLNDWESLNKNIRASQALDAIAAHVEQENFIRAHQAMVEAMDTYRDTKMFTHIRRDEIRRLSTKLLQAPFDRTAKNNSPQGKPAAGRPDSEPFLPRRARHTQDVELRVTIKNREIHTGFHNFKLEIYGVAEDLNRRGRFKLGIKESETFSLPIRGEHNFTTKSVHLQFRDYGNYESGFKYYGYLCMMLDGDGEMVLVKSSKTKLERNQDQFLELKESGQFSM